MKDTVLLIAIGVRFALNKFESNQVFQDITGLHNEQIDSVRKSLDKAIALHLLSNVKMKKAIALHLLSNVKMNNQDETVDSNNIDNVSFDNDSEL